jgi:demethylmenaquinone methyltransferase/2-methoxy-6-polyprenyl-1,4-benzoquinol methylase
VIKPYNNSDKSKKSQVEEMFDNIAWRYDFLNHFLSIGIDKHWRRKAIKLLSVESPKRILDVATGTGDFAIAASKINPDSITGIDLSKQMLQIGKEKVIRKKLESVVTLLEGDAENLSFDDKSFDAFIVAFGVRNFESLEQGLHEMFRVLKPGGMGLILEFSKPGNSLVRHFYSFYFYRVLPFFGRWFSKDRKAYSYLPDSVGAFPDRKEFISLMETIGFEKTRYIDLTFGIATIFTGYRTVE